MAATLRTSSEADPAWSRRRLLGLLVAGTAVAAGLLVGLVLAVVQAVRPAPGVPAVLVVPGPNAASPSLTVNATDQGSLADMLAAAPMPTVPETASHPSPLSTVDPGPSITLAAATRSGPVGVPTGFAHTPEGALAQLAAIDVTALGTASLPAARDIVTAWALPGGPTAQTWSGVRAIAGLLDAAKVSGGSGQIAVLARPLMGLVKGSVGPDLVVVCVDFEVDVTLTSTARGAIADCQRMAWSDGRWQIGPGAEPAEAPSVWPGTQMAYEVGYRDLTRG